MGTGYVDDFSEQKKKKSFDIGAEMEKLKIMSIDERRLIKVPGTLRFQKIVILDSLKITNISNIEIMYLI